MKQKGRCLYMSRARSFKSCRTAKKKNQEQYSTILKVMIQSKYSIRFLKILKTKIKKSDRKTNVPILVHAYNHIKNIRLL